MGAFHRNVNWNVVVTCGILPQVLWKSQRTQINIDYLAFLLVAHQNRMVRSTSEYTTYFGHRMWRNQAGNNQEAPSLLANTNQEASSPLADTDQEASSLLAGTDQEASSLLASTDQEVSSLLADTDQETSSLLVSFRSLIQLWTLWDTVTDLSRNSNWYNYSLSVLR